MRSDAGIEGGHMDGVQRTVESGVGRGAARAVLLVGALAVGMLAGVPAAALADHPVSSESMQEGDSGTATMTFTISSSGVTGCPAPAHAPCRFLYHYQTVSETATEGDDYEGTQGGQACDFGFPRPCTITVDVPIKGDTEYEPDETFELVVLESVCGPSSCFASHHDSGTGTIENDDLPPCKDDTSGAQEQGPVSGPVHRVDEFFGSGQPDTFGAIIHGLNCDVFVNAGL